MKAVVWSRYGSPEVLKLRDVEKPMPKDDEVLIKIVAATVFVGDCEMRRFDFPLSFWLPLRIMFGIFRPRKKVLGQELAGVVEATGTNVTNWHAGDEVFAPTDMNFGAYAEYVCLPASHPIAKKPTNMSYEEAATVPTGGLNALHFLRKAEIQEGDKVLINGAGGSIGTFATQIAKVMGAEVTAVDDASKLNVLQSLGADHIVDYRKEDFTKNGERYDVIVDVVGKSSYSGSVRSLREGGRYVLGNPRMPGMLRSLWTSATGDKKVIVALAPYKIEDLLFLKDMIESGQLRSIIDRRYPLDEIQAAHQYVESGRKTGNVVVNVS